ncbi:S1 family peptidase [Pseudobacteriovorax antillogorgiicola]|uniref:Trypsin-like peptidase domain-containing protein n=1 Tax=Pseudobacteriovorax antillogorgiicola TaxID=1513793 RepID=A0A1Y6CQJ4_9BACT|nr:serine protease [Pseudobacteriovorax antillogorgiicola]TCS51619.1 hypothetical protein EDD56_1103 [Pseudobacteriovorax antillogorgiicola]SMF81472.1 hypothetical protein SAMN06296036_1373 [Pseudobacteriovorax antillogorgiicola]
MSAGFGPKLAAYRDPTPERLKTDFFSSFSIKSGISNGESQFHYRANIILIYRQICFILPWHIAVTEGYPESDVVRLEVDGYIWEYLELETEVLTVDSPISMVDRKGNTQYSAQYGFLNVDVEGEITVQDGVFAHGIPAVPGNSGSPILKDGKVVGVHLGKVGQDMFYAADVSMLGYVEHKFAADKQAIQVIPFILGAGRACMSSTKCMKAVGKVALAAGTAATYIFTTYLDMQKEITLQEMKYDKELELLKTKHGYDLQKEILKAQLAQKNGKGNDKADIKLDKPIPG